MKYHQIKIQLPHAWSIPFQIPEFSEIIDIIHEKLDYSEHLIIIYQSNTDTTSLKNCNIIIQNNFDNIPFGYKYYKSITTPKIITKIGSYQLDTIYTNEIKYIFLQELKTTAETRHNNINQILS